MESNINIKTIGFEAAAEFLSSLNDRLFRFRDLCPYDSFLDVTIVKKAVQFEVSIALNFVGGHMDAESFGLDLNRITTKALEKLYARICQWHTERFESEDKPVVQPSYIPKVLIVDDDPLSTQFLDHCLRKSGCATHFVESGAAAVDEIARGKYDLLFLDWNMPGMNGAETLLSAQNMISFNEKLRERYADARMPVITFSGQSRKDIHLPECPHFRLVDHWDKSTPLHQLLRQASDILFRFKTPLAEVG